MSNGLDEIISLLNDNVNVDEPFTNNIGFDKSCLLITMIFILLFIYKKEVIKFFN
jgi:hypothetical protein